MGTRSYISLLRAYHEGKMFGEAEALLKQIKKAGLVEKMSDEAMTVSGGESDLAESIIWELGEEVYTVSSVVYEYNSSIYFFWKAKMIGEGLNTYRKMQKMKIEPIVQTFFNMVSGYSSLEMYRDITILWGDIKRNFVVNRDLFELLILNFL
ncbi:Pentatricopeptide repeat-containing protein [Camellia lanceoleosa]|uniref:Pentatricopeptide repeat-containing protein n=1 Tax=Camellia lanceoleosa TaxID=1840588 RepID=A0ACC0FGS0_9ERIC|nr:Pentatricopeptide repeat-containing protein [Camellia lanceoleosa]